MPTERIGYIICTESFGDTQHANAEVVGLGFLPCTQLPNGTYEVWSAKQEKESEKLGFKKVLAVVSNVTRKGTKIHHNGIQAYFMKTCSDELEARLRMVPESVIAGIVNGFYEQL